MKISLIFKTFTPKLAHTGSSQIVTERPKTYLHAYNCVDSDALAYISVREITKG